MTDTATIGHNMAPPYDLDAHSALHKSAVDFADAAGAWLDLKEIETEAQAEKLNDYIFGARKIAKKILAQSKIDKAPHDRAGKEVLAAYRALTAPLETAANRLKPFLATWAIKKQAILDEEQRVAREAAEKAAVLAADDLERARARNDVIGETQAEEAAKQAAKDTKKASKTLSSNIASGTGGGGTVALRTYRSAAVVNRRIAFLTIEKLRPAALDDVLTSLANEAIRGGIHDEADLPGFKINVEKRC